MVSKKQRNWIQDGFSFISQQRLTAQFDNNQVQDNTILWLAVWKFLTSTLEESWRDSFQSVFHPLPVIKFYINQYTWLTWLVFCGCGDNVVHTEWKDEYFYTFFRNSWNEFSTLFFLNVGTTTRPAREMCYWNACVWQTLTRSAPSCILLLLSYSTLVHFTSLPHALLTKKLG